MPNGEVVKRDLGYDVRSQEEIKQSLQLLSINLVNGNLSVNIDTFNDMGHGKK